MIPILTVEIQRKRNQALHKKTPLVLSLLQSYLLYSYSMNVYSPVEPADSVLSCRQNMVWAELIQYHLHRSSSNTITTAAGRSTLESTLQRQRYEFSCHSLAVLSMIRKERLNHSQRSEFCHACTAFEKLSIFL